MLARLPRIGQISVLLVSGLMAILLVSGSASTRITYQITDGSLSYEAVGHAGEVEAALESVGVGLTNRSLVSTAQEGDVVRVTVHRPVSRFEEHVAEIQSYETVRREDPDLPLGEERVLQVGVSGVIVDRIQIVTDPDGSVRRYYLGQSVAKERVDEIVAYGTKVEEVPASWLSVSQEVITNLDADGDGGGVLTISSGEKLRYSKVIDCVATAYTTERQSWKLTATGTTARVGAIAVDPTVIPYGTRMYIVSADGSITYGVATAEDCGGSIKGNRIDLFFDTYNECINFGVQDCSVYILT